MALNRPTHGVNKVCLAVDAAENRELDKRADEWISVAELGHADVQPFSSGQTNRV